MARPSWPLHASAFAATALLTERLMGDAAPPLGAGALAVWSCAIAACVLLALASAAPLGWTARLVARCWRTPFLSLGVGLLAWWTAALLEGTWGALSGGTLHAAGWILRHLTTDVVVDPVERLVGAHGFGVVIAPICSGVNGVGLVLVFQLVWIFVSRSRLRFPRTLLLLPLGAVAALLANVLRIAVLVLVGAAGHDRLALGGFHSKLGWMLFVPIALGSIALAEHVAWFQKESGRSEEDALPNATANYVAPLVAALAAALATSLWAVGPFDAWYGLRAGAAATALLLVRRHLPPFRPALSLAPLAVAAAVALLWIAWPSSGNGAALSEAVTALAPPARWSWIAIRLLGSCLVLPIAEELAFRGFLLPALVSPDFESVPGRAWTVSAVLLSSAAFGALHSSWLPGTLAGFAFAAARLWRGRLCDAILAHALVNAAVAAAVLQFGRWDLWS